MDSKERMTRRKGDEQASPLLSTSVETGRREGGDREEYQESQRSIDSPSIEASLGNENEGSVEEHPYYSAIDIHDEEVKKAFFSGEDDERQKTLRTQANESRESAVDTQIVAVAAAGKPRNPLMIAAMLSVAAAYGSILGTFFLLTLPLECSRMSRDGSTKSVNLGIFIFVAGFTQLASPWIGVASDSLNNPQSSKCHKFHQHKLGRRRPFLILGYVLCSLSFSGMKWCSISEFWVFYGVFYTVVMLALNILYSALIALIPDLISPEQTGIANGIFAMLVVSGSLVGFVVFTYVLNTEGDLGDVYDFYNLFLLATTVLTVLTACEESVARVDQPPSSLTLSEEEPLLSETGRRTSTTQNGNTTDGAATKGPAKVEAKLFNDSATFTQQQDKKTQSTCQLLCSRKIVTVLLTALSVSTSSLFSVSWNNVLHAYWLDPKEHHDFFVVTISRGFYYMGVSSQTFLMYFLNDIIQDVINPQEAVALLSVVGFAAGACTSYPVGYLSDKLNKRRKPYVYVSCLILAGGLISLLFCQTFHQVMLVSAIVGCANGAYLAMDTSLAVDTLPDKSDAAKFLGIWGVAGFVGSAMGPMLGGPMLYAFGTLSIGSNMSSSDADETQPAILEGQDVQSYSIAGYAVVFCLSAVYFGCSAFSLRWVENSD